MFSQLAAAGRGALIRCRRLPAACPALRTLGAPTALSEWRAFSTSLSEPTREVKRDLHVDPGSAHHSKDSLPDLRPLEEAPSEVQEFSDFSSAHVVRSICHANVPGWSALPVNNILIDQLCEGLSNQNFKVHLDIPESERPAMTSCVLFRVYGKGVNMLYDSDLEVKIVNMLSHYNIGPAIFAHDRDWRIEGWHYSVPLPNRSMKNPAIFAQMAAHMGRLHKLDLRPDFPSEIKSLPAHTTTRFTKWGDACKWASGTFKQPENIAKVEELEIDEMMAEREWLAGFLKDDDPKIPGSGLDTVFSHWDCQENNVLQTLYGLRFIDFEYSGMEYQAFDIACYFVECTIDYLVPSYPFYKMTLSDFPGDDEMRLFCSIYLSEYLETTVRQKDLAVDVLMDRVRRFTLASHLLWAMWSVIRASQAPTFGGFDYLHYAKCRYFMYKWTKRALLHHGRVG